MPNYDSQATYQPSIPKHLFSKDDINFIEAFGVSIESDGYDKFYLFEENWCSDAQIVDSEGNEIEHGEEQLLGRFQEIIRRSNGELSWISRETSYTCSKMAPDGFGGSAVFITVDDIQYFGTSSWLGQRISEAETGDIGPHTDNLPLAKPILGIVFSKGGLLQAVISNDPGQLPIDSIVFIDYDTEYADKEDLVDVPQGGDDTIVSARGSICIIEKSGIDLANVIAQIYP